MAPIKREDIRVGDIVRRTFTVVVEGTVAFVGSYETLENDTDSAIHFGTGPVPFKQTLMAPTWELLDRPAPKPAHGSRWKTTINTRLIYDAHRDTYIVWEANRISAFNVGDMVAASAITGLEADDDV